MRAVNGVSETDLEGLNASPDSTGGTAKYGGVLWDGNGKNEDCSVRKEGLCVENNSSQEHEIIPHDKSSNGIGEKKREQSSFLTALGSLITESPRELWLVFLLKYMESYAYFVFSYTLILFLSEEFGLGDEQAGFVYGLYGMLVSVYGFLIGLVIDHLGVKWSLVCGTLLLFCSRMVLTVTDDFRVLSLILFGALPIGTAMGIPVMQIGIRRYTSEKSRSLGYSLFYVTMNLAAITAAPAIDAFHQAFPSGVTVRIGGGGKSS
eukprot:GDKI01031815.1.p1 GENE.GDKI01031815.1~~GDKI01031815.1.p1  ORF type:complete len:263 (-),score=48.84 GDKI01031815.1:121-909(-)